MDALLYDGLVVAAKTAGSRAATRMITRIPIARLGLAALLISAASACTTSGGSRMGLFTATAPVVSVIADDVFVGTAVGYIDRTGTIDMSSTVRPDVRCVGEFRYTGSRTGQAALRCSDGLQADVMFNALSTLSGYGYGVTSRGPVSFTYGLTAAEAAKYLRIPPETEFDATGPKPMLKKVEPKAQTTA